MIAFASCDRPNVLHRRDWYAVWCYLPSAKVRTIWHEKEARSVVDLARNAKTDEIALINGGYFVPRPSPRGASTLIGGVGLGMQKWHHGVTSGAGKNEFRRWIVGWRSLESGAPKFALELMTSRAGKPGFWPPSDFEKQFPFGLSGLLCLMRDGEAHVWRDSKRGLHWAPEPQGKAVAKFSGPYFRHAALGWTNDGKHLFMVVKQNPRDILDVRDLFGRFGGRRQKAPGPLLAGLRLAWAKLPSAERPCPAKDLPSRIENAVLLDGGHCATVVYRRRLGRRVEEFGSWLTGTPATVTAPRVPTMIEVTAG